MGDIFSEETGLLSAVTADLAVKAAGALIEANLDDERNRKLVEDLIAGIPSGS